jgi:hypothetical protein
MCGSISPQDVLQEAKLELAARELVMIKCAGIPSDVADGRGSDAKPRSK